jgi:hypothetical protein
MMIPEQLRANGRELRRAIARRQYGDLPRKLEELRGIAEEHLADLPVGDALRQEIVAWTLGTIEWARLMVATQRQVWSEELALLPKVGRYLDDSDRRTRTMCLDL